MDVLSGEEIYKKIFKFWPTEPLSAKFEELDYGDLNYVMNSGSILIMLMLVLLEPIGRFIINKISLWLSRFRIARRTGVYFYQADTKNHLRRALLRLAMECYFELAMCTFLNLEAFKVCSTWQEFKVYVSTPDDILSSALTLVTLVIVVLFPIGVYYKITTKFDQLGQRSSIEKYGPLFDEFRLETKASAAYQVIFMTRRLLIVMVLVLLRNYTFYQGMILLPLSLANLGYLCRCKPFKSHT